MDGLIVNGLKFLTTISHYVHHRTASLLPASPHEDMIDKANEVIDVYETEGFTTKEINCDKRIQEGYGHSFSEKKN